MSTDQGDLPSTSADDPKQKVYYSETEDGKKTILVDGDGQQIPTKRKVGRPETEICRLKRPTGGLFTPQDWWALKKRYKTGDDEMKRHLEDEYGLETLTPPYGTDVNEICAFLDGLD